jgi:hypothetical protein
MYDVKYLFRVHRSMLLADFFKIAIHIHIQAQISECLMVKAKILQRAVIASSEVLFI